MSTPTALIPAQAAARLDDYTVIDVRTPGEYASGHLPGAHNIPLDHLHTALPMVCASGNRSTTACTELAAADIPATTLTGGTTAWAGEGHTLHRPDNATAVWPMERQVRLAAGTLVVLGLAAGTRWRSARWLAAAIGGGLIFSAATNTCGIAAALAKLPHNQPRTTDLHTTLRALQD
ncbi:rhodanese-like domain-containing protein [Streptomyces cocklensis]|jgi:rhodanese-related sulfurtransferase|uniref:Inner membrane protein YgaP n=1 Tax=Actinacidiphila cocklensis TaxID=887465 RepID=A0A9W4GRD3_9ACTN|nr:rhodanese-like domain-containing protein [Actinacidiphila cocklensis]MDD1063187.1 rhodanese-like domain-containing protein [Actinacidiphila cocklensis]CAG6393603.1 Inner membrane protein YgaP [Actinacidiphila cocklensis]